MTRLLIVGNGQAAAAVLKTVAAAGDLEVLAFLTSDAPPRKEDGIQRLPEGHIRDLEALQSRGLLDADWLLIANSTVLIPGTVLAALRGEALNLHPGLLPEYAGLHTHQWAIRNGESEFGATIHRVVARVDAGAIVRQSRFPIEYDDTGFTLFRKCMKSGQELLVSVLEDIAAGSALEDQEQDLRGRRNYRHSDALDDRIDWSLGAREVRDFIRAGSYGMFQSPTYTATIHGLAGEDIKVLAADIVDRPVGTGGPGAILDVADAGPIIACGGDQALQLTKGTCGGKALNSEGWRSRIAGAVSLT